MTDRLVLIKQCYQQSNIMGKSGNRVAEDVLFQAAQALETPQKQQTIVEKVEALARQKRIVENTFLVSIRQLDDEILALWEKERQIDA